MSTDSVADVLTRIRNAQTARHRSVRVKKSNLAEGVLTVLKDEGFVDPVEVKKDRAEKFDEFDVVLKYFPSGDPVIRTAQRFSRPGLRMYRRASDLPRVHNGLGISIVSTSKGVISDRIARKENVGGEVLALVSSQ